jgi:hypothetical protein
MPLYRSPQLHSHGRLAQLVEHLLYTQGVGGSSPSPPTPHCSSARGRRARFTGETSFPRGPPSVVCSRPDVSLLSPNKFGSATEDALHKCTAFDELESLWALRVGRGLWPSVRARHRPYGCRSCTGESSSLAAAAARSADAAARASRGGGRERRPGGGAAARRAVRLLRGAAAQHRPTARRVGAWELQAVAFTLAVGPVAQLVEQGTFNPKVTGSIPVRPIALHAA